MPLDELEEDILLYGSLVSQTICVALLTIMSQHDKFELVILTYSSFIDTDRFQQ